MRKYLLTCILFFTKLCIFIQQYLVINKNYYYAYINCYTCHYYCRSSPLACEPDSHATYCQRHSQSHCSDPSCNLVAEGIWCACLFTAIAYLIEIGEYKNIDLAELLTVVQLNQDKDVAAHQNDKKDRDRATALIYSMLHVPPGVLSRGSVFPCMCWN